MSAIQGFFNTGTASPGNTVAVTGVGFTPKVIIFWWNGRTETSDTAARASHQLGFGVGISITDRRSIASISGDSLADSSSFRRHSDDACVLALDAEGEAGKLDVQSMDSDGFTLIVDEAFSSSLRVGYLAIGGNELTHYTTGQFQEPGATGDQDTTSLSFQPDFLLLFSAMESTAPTFTGTDATIMIGAAVSSTEQAVYCGGSDSGAATTQTISHARGSDQCVALLDSTITSVNASASFSQFLSNGFRLNWASRSSTRYIHFLAMKGGNFDVGEMLTEDDLVTSIPVTTGFRPDGNMIIAPMNTESSSTTAVNQGEQLSIGAFTSTSNRGMMSISDRDNAGTTEIYTTVDSDTIYRNESTAGGTLIALMDVQSIDDTGFTCIMDDAESGPRFAWYMSFRTGTDGQPIQLRGLQVPFRGQWKPGRLGG